MISRAKKTAHASEQDRPDSRDGKLPNGSLTMDLGLDLPAAKPEDVISSPISTICLAQMVFGACRPDFVVKGQQSRGRSRD
jgi:hypothetical protein